MAIVPVLIDDWQQECCGDVFAVGDTVSWLLDYDAYYSDLLRPEESVRLTLGVMPIPQLRGARKRPVHLHSGALHVFWEKSTAQRGPVEISGVLHEERHGTSSPVPRTVGVVRRIRRIAMGHGRKPGTRTWNRLRRTESFTELTSSATAFDSGADAPDNADVAQWDVGLLVDLDVELSPG